MIQELLEQVVQAVATIDHSLGEATIPPLPAQPAGSGIPTLKEAFYRPFTPMLQARFTNFGSWPQATHGRWLSLAEMEALWHQPSDSTLAGIQTMLQANAENWANDAIALFKPERISVFAADATTTERIYLLWFDFVAEPELWVYDTNGEAHYQDLALYLKAYLDEDLTAYAKQWILEYPTA